MEISAQFLVQSSPFRVAKGGRAPFDKTRNLDPKLHSMGMSTQGEMDKLGEIFHLLIKMGWVVAHQDFKAAIVWELVVARTFYLKPI